MGLLRIIALGILAVALHAQQTGTVRGVLTDNSGAVIPAASVTLSSNGAQKVALSQVDGTFSFAGLAPGDYTVKVSFPGFAPVEKTVTVSAAGTVQLPIQLLVSAGKQEVTVSGQAGATTVSVDPENNATAVVMKGSDLDALPDDPGDLNDMLQALAGPAAGPNGGQLYVDGFTGGRLPPKSSIREIRINQNPLSAEYDRLGFGRIEILTKPGSEKFHGGIGLNDSDGVMNSRNPYADNKADYSNRFIDANVSGPLGKRASFFLNFGRFIIDNDALIKGATLDPVTLQETPVRMSVVTPMREWEFGPRIDYQLSTNHTLSARFEFNNNTRRNNGIGQYSLLSRAYDSEESGREVRLTETAILNPRTVNETRFGFDRTRFDQYADNALPAINVSEAFSAGGSQVGRASNRVQRFELQNNTSTARGAHTIRFGGRIRHSGITEISPANFGGTFSFFGVGDAPVLDSDNRPLATTMQIGSLEQYRRTLLFQRLGYSAAEIRALGGGASQYSVAGGDPLSGISQTDIGVFAQDDWRVKANFTLSLGLRYETQTNLGDWRDFAPRLGIAWAPKAKQGSPQKTVIRAGFGVYYDRIGPNLTLQELRFNGVHQQQFVVLDPDFFPAAPPVSALNAQKVPLSIYRKDSELRAPFITQSVLSVERQLPRRTTLAATYLHMHSSHNIRSVNINAPLPGTYNPALGMRGVRPYGDAAGNLFLYEAGGVMNQNMFMMSTNTRFSSKVSLNGIFQLMKAESDADGMGSPSNPYNFRQDYGRAGFVRSYRAQLQGSLLAPLGIRLNPMIVLAAGAPYNLISGHDLNGDTIANDRPAFAADMNRPSVVFTRFGAFDTNPLPGQQIVPRNYLTGKGMWNFNLRIGRNFSFGTVKGAKGTGGPVDPGMRAPSASLGGNVQQRPSSGGGEKRFTLNFNAFINNVFNHLNPGGYVGNLASPLFGQATAINLFRETSNNRRIQLGTQLNF